MLLSTHASVAAFSATTMAFVAPPIVVHGDTPSLPAALASQRCHVQYIHSHQISGSEKRGDSDRRELDVSNRYSCYVNDVDEPCISTFLIMNLFL